MEIPALIACDLDGTLLLDGAQKLNEGTTDLIRQLIDRGVLFMAASGRQIDNLVHLFAPLGDRMSYLCENGCVTFADGKLISRESLSYEDGAELIHAIEETKDAHVMINGLHTCYIPDEPAYVHHVRDVVKNNVTVVQDLYEEREPWFKISLFEKEGLHDVDWWKEKFSDRFQVVTGGNEWLDFMPKGITKQTGMEKLLAYLHVDPKDVMVFGNNENDVEMLKYCGMPVAMENGRQCVKDLTEKRTDLVEKDLKQILEALS